MIPAYQCEGTVGRVVEGVRHHLERVVVVDDGSRDATARAALAAGAEVLSLPANRGKGFALRAGIERALAGTPTASTIRPTCRACSRPGTRAAPTW